MRSLDRRTKLAARECDRLELMGLLALTLAVIGATAALALMALRAL